MSMAMRDVAESCRYAERAAWRKLSSRKAPPRSMPSSEHCGRRRPLQCERAVSVLAGIAEILLSQRTDCRQYWD